MGIVTVRRADDDESDVVSDGETVSVRMQMRDSSPPDDAELDDRHKAYFERSARLQDAWRKDRGMPGTGKVGAVADERRALPPDLRGADARVFDDAKNQQLRDAANAGYVKRLASAWQQNRG